MAHSTSRYTLTAILFHWLTAVLVVALLAIGWYMVELPKGASRGDFFQLHKSIGLSVFVLLWARLAWRLSHPPPELPTTLARWQRYVVKVVHLAFYVLLIAQPLSGYLSASFSGYRTAWFGVPLPYWSWRDAPLNELFTEIHVVGSICLVLLLVMHLLGSLSHLVQGDSALFKRMWPW